MSIFRQVSQVIRRRLPRIKSRAARVRLFIFYPYFDMPPLFCWPIPSFDVPPCCILLFMPEVVAEIDSSDAKGFQNRGERRRPVSVFGDPSLGKGGTTNSGTKMGGIMDIIFVSFGMQKFTLQSAQGIVEYICNSPFISWLSVLGIRGEAYVLGIAELSVATLLVAGAFSPVLSAVGALMGIVTFAITWSFFFTTPGVVT